MGFGEGHGRRGGAQRGASDPSRSAGVTAKRIQARMFSLKDLGEKAHPNLGMGASVETSLLT